MTINPETEIVSTQYDSAANTCSYTIERNGKRWTAVIPLQHLDVHKGPNHKALRRAHIAKALETRMMGEPDPLPPAPEPPIELAKVRPW